MLPISVLVLVTLVVLFTTCDAANVTSTDAPTSPLVFTTTPTVAPATAVTVQFQSRFALGQLTATRLANLVNVLATLLAVGSSQLSIVVLLGTGAVSVVRFSVSSSLVQATVIQTVTTAAANSTSDLYVVAQPVASTIQPVISCAASCIALGTASSFRNADNTACTCTCANKWSGTNCGSCSFPFAGTNCDQCATGTVGYPNCYALPNCTQPALSRFVVSWSAACAAAMQSRSTTACASQQCACTGGVYNSVTLSCVGGNASSCAAVTCASTARQCQFSADLAALKARSACVNETAALTASLSSQNAWCVFDQCVSGASTTCGTDFISASCALFLPASSYAVFPGLGVVFVAVASLFLTL